MPPCPPTTNQPMQNTPIAASVTLLLTNPNDAIANAPRR